MVAKPQGVKFENKYHKMTIYEPYGSMFLTRLPSAPFIVISISI